MQETKVFDFLFAAHAQFSLIFMLSKHVLFAHDKSAKNQALLI
ncbi:hypothetical protein HMPREF0653_01995 [Prevotella disiens JCM 6334 = ATCC 29426]|uniref:Uncharacterized protein n=1 Tax=Prevotella disiens JCM 6334 = ATCC 29426 TaxID=1235811 RepID=A0ABN0NQL6_9BACT|nr:hypothetical protein HMPREF0653_01995 [Prevotella disiens JCM 6334 = ATCC 29426]